MKETILPILSFAPSAVLGWLIVRLLLKGHSRGMLGVFAGLGIGIGIDAVFFFPVYTFQLPIVFQAVVECIIILLLAIRFNHIRRQELPDAPEYSEIRVLRWIPVAMSVIVCIAVLNTSTTYFIRAFQMPHGDGDAYMCWNLKARYMLWATGSNWAGLFTKDYTHPDYPLLVPGAIASHWKLVGGEVKIIPILVHFFMAMSVIGVVYSSLRYLKSKIMAQIAALFLLCMPFFTKSAANQFADLPLSFYYLMTCVSVVLAFNEKDKVKQNMIFAACGLFASLAAWTKNEGLLFSMALGVCLLGAFVTSPRQGLRNCLSYVIGAIPVFVLIAYFKIYLAPAHDLVVIEDVDTFEKFTNVHRYITVTNAYLTTALGFGQWWITPFPVSLAYILIARWHPESFRKGILVAASSILIILTGYFFIYIGFYFEHIGSSLDRLFLQVTPSILFLFCMSVNTPENILQRISR